MDFAVVRLFGKQHLVKEGDLIVVNAKIDTKDLTIDEVLLLNVGEDLKIGTPLVEKAVVKVEVMKTGKGKKIDIIKFKAKSRYRRKMGFRPLETTLKILNIGETPKQSSIVKKSPVVKKPKILKTKGVI